MSGTVVPLDDYRDDGPWIVAKGTCAACGSVCVSVMPEDCPRDNTECPNCGEWRWCVTHYERDGEMVPRLETVP